MPAIISADKSALESSASVSEILDNMRLSRSAQSYELQDYDNHQSTLTNVSHESIKLGTETRAKYSSCVPTGRRCDFTAISPRYQRKEKSRNKGGVFRGQAIR
jgi:hypothetical protein